MRARSDGRTDTQMRPLRITPGGSKFATGSAIIDLGDTRVHCTASAEDGVPFFLSNSVPAQGWLTAEYAMLPGATPSRSRRERNHISGRTQEIQRLIGRSLRGVIDLTKCPGLTLTLDCDVLQADGGTRTASITGVYVALKIAIMELLRKGRIRQNPLCNAVAAVSIGITNGRLLCDLNYQEDSSTDLDMNVVMTQDGGILEIQGTAEKSSFSKEQLNQIVDLASASLQSVFPLQSAAADGLIAESPSSQPDN